MRKGVIQWHDRPCALLSQDHPSVTYVGQTKEFLGVISSRWGSVGGEGTSEWGRL